MSINDLANSVDVQHITTLTPIYPSSDRSIRIITYVFDVDENALNEDTFIASACHNTTNFDTNIAFSNGKSTNLDCYAIEDDDYALDFVCALFDIEALMNELLEMNDVEYVNDSEEIVRERWEDKCVGIEPTAMTLPNIVKALFDIDMFENESLSIYDMRALSQPENWDIQIETKIIHPFVFD